MRRDGHYYDLYRSNSRGKRESSPVAVSHYERAHKSSRYAPARLIRMLERSVPVEELYIERLAEILRKIMRRSSLKALSVEHHRLHSVRSACACELLILALSSRYDGYSEHVLHELFVHAEHLERLFHSFLFGRVKSVSFLP